MIDGRLIICMYLMYKEKGGVVYTCVRIVSIVSPAMQPSNSYSVAMLYPFLSAMTKFFLPDVETALVSELFYIALCVIQLPLTLCSSTTHCVIQTGMLDLLSEPSLLDE